MAPDGQNTFPSETGSVPEMGCCSLVLFLGTWAPAAGSLESAGYIWAPELGQGPGRVAVLGLWLQTLAWISWVPQMSGLPVS